MNPKVVSDHIEHSNVRLFLQNGAHVLNPGDSGPRSKQGHSCSGRSGITVPATVWRYVCLQICPQMSRKPGRRVEFSESNFVGSVIPLDCISPTHHTLIYAPASGALSWSRPGAETKLAFFVDYWRGSSRIRPTSAATCLRWSPGDLAHILSTVGGGLGNGPTI